jgi:hypothetical protein
MENAVFFGPLSCPRIIAAAPKPKCGGRLRQSVQQAQMRLRLLAYVIRAAFAGHEAILGLPENACRRAPTGRTLASSAARRHGFEECAGQGGLSRLAARETRRRRVTPTIGRLGR